MRLSAQKVVPWSFETYNITGMNRLISIFVLLSAVMPCYAQTASSGSAHAQTPERAASIPKTDLLSPFSGLEIDGPMNVTLKRIDKSEDTRIVYDTKGDISSKFKASVNKDGMLRVEEGFDQKRENVTDVTIYYDSLSYVKVAHATVSFDGPLECRILDMSVTGGAAVTADVQALDTFIECTGKSSLIINGSSRYLKIGVSTAKIEAWGLNTVSSTIEASHGANVRIRSSERLEAVTSTGAKIFYRGNPGIVRGKTSLFGGDIISVD